MTKQTTYETCGTVQFFCRVLTSLKEGLVTHVLTFLEICDKGDSCIVSFFSNQIHFSVVSYTYQKKEPKYVYADVV